MGGLLGYAFRELGRLPPVEAMKKFQSHARNLNPHGKGWTVDAEKLGLGLETGRQLAFLILRPNSSNRRPLLLESAAATK